MGLPSPVPLRKSKSIIPKKQLLSWIESNVDTEGVEIIKVRDALLWSKGDVERHRLDVFEKYLIDEGDFCWTNRIGERSFFLHYHKAEKTITDRTVGRYVEKKKKGLFK